METIEERYGCSNCQCPCCEGCSIWDKVEGATEQKAIDDAERDTAVYNLLQLKLDNEKELWLDKACKWMEKELLKLSMDEIKENFLDNEFKVVLKSDIPKWIRNFRKAMKK